MLSIACFSPQNYPPYIPSNIPFLGHAIAFGKSPIEFLEHAYEKVSDRSYKIKPGINYVHVKIEFASNAYNFAVNIFRVYMEVLFTFYY